MSPIATLKYYDTDLDDYVEVPLAGADPDIGLTITKTDTGTPTDAQTVDEDETFLCSDGSPFQLTIPSAGVWIVSVNALLTRPDDSEITESPYAMLMVDSTPVTWNPPYSPFTSTAMTMTTTVTTTGSAVLSLRNTYEPARLGWTPALHPAHELRAVKVG